MVVRSWVTKLPPTRWLLLERGTTQVVDYAFHLAARRNGRPRDGKKCVTCVDKAHVFRSLALFRKVFFDVAADHPDISADAVYVDAISLVAWDLDRPPRSVKSVVYSNPRMEPRRPSPAKTSPTHGDNSFSRNDAGLAW